MAWRPRPRRNVSEARSRRVRTGRDTSRNCTVGPVLSHERVRYLTVQLKALVTVSPSESGALSCSDAAFPALSDCGAGVLSAGDLFVFMMVMWNVALAVPPRPSLAVTVMSYSPADLNDNVPEMFPDAGSTFSPCGRPGAWNVSVSPSGSLATTAIETLSPSACAEFESALMLGARFPSTHSDRQ